MSAHTDSVPLPTGSLPNSREAPARARTQRDLELVARIARGDADAVELLAARMAPRANRVARALMASADDAGDAALHALIELLRAHANYHGQLRLERWGDRVIALAVVRYARAVRARAGHDERPPADASRALSLEERGARTFEQYLAQLTEGTRQLLLLRHALGFALGELAEALQCSLTVAKEQLLGARRELRTRVRRRQDGVAAPLGPGAQRWGALRDREALGESLTVEELEELAQLETRDAEVWAFAAQVRALELFFDPTRSEPESARDHELAARAVAAFEVTSPTLRTSALALEPDPAARPPKADSHWVTRVAIGLSVALAAASALALWFHDPRAVVPAPEPSEVSAPVSATPSDPWATAALRPIVESMPSARTLRGAKLRSEGRWLEEGTLLAQGELVETGERAGCLQIEPDTEVCLAPWTRLTLTSLLAKERQLALPSGRVSIRIGPLSETARWVLRAGAVELSTTRAVYGVERSVDGKLLRVRTLRGQLAARIGDVTQQLEEAQSASLRAGASLDVATLPPAHAQRDWELLATGLYPSMVPLAAVRAANVDTAAPSGLSPVQAAARPPTPVEQQAVSPQPDTQVQPEQEPAPSADAPAAAMQPTEVALTASSVPPSALPIREPSGGSDELLPPSQGESNLESQAASAVVSP